MAQVRLLMSLSYSATLHKMGKGKEKGRLHCSAIAERGACCLPSSLPSAVPSAIFGLEALETPEVCHSCKARHFQDI